MTKKQFEMLFEYVNCPAYRGGPAPQFNPYAINEAEFEDDLRFKDFDIKFSPKTQNVAVTWISQGDCSIHDRFDIELIRVFKNVIGISGNINVTLYSRGCEDEAEVYTL